MSKNKKTNNESLGSGNKGRKRSSDILANIRDFFRENQEPIGYMAMVRRLKIKDKKAKLMAKQAIFSLEKEGYLGKTSTNKYYLSELVDHGEGLSGRVDHVNARFAYVIVEDMDEDIWVKTDDLAGAIHGDQVALMITRQASGKHRAEGKVTKILKRDRTEFVGRIEVSPNFSFVVPDNRNIHFDIFVYPEKIMNAGHNDKVLVKILQWHNEKNKSPMGEVVMVLGPAGENEAEIHSIMAEFGLPFQFPEHIEKEAKKIPQDITEADYRERRDLRDVVTFTIDPHDAKDFDDALSVQQLSKDRLQVGIHIADVAHYVREGSSLDKEAIERATSVYLVDRTIPMLPEVLSNGLCSLRPNEEKLAFSAIFELDLEGHVHDQWFGRTVIYSDRRFTYEEAQERIERKSGEFEFEINQLNEVASKIRARRFKQGAVNFETTEVKFKLDEKGRPVEVYTKERKEAHKMIEEFMLLANRAVATYVFKLKGVKGAVEDPTFVYRVHDDPDPEKLSTFSSFAGRFGHQVNLEKGISHSLNHLMKRIEGKPEQNILEQLAIRSMSKAVYTTDARGHFGLSFDHYTHFTSPIRRYPDVMVHRLLANYLDKRPSPGQDEYEKLCVHSSTREKRAADAERASIKFKQVEYMSGMLGQEFEGLVSGVTEWGIFVEILETKCEGMVRISDLGDDYYDFDEKNLKVVGRNNGRIITLGDKLQVKVVKTDIDRRTIDLLLVED